MKMGGYFNKIVGKCQMSDCYTIQYGYTNTPNWTLGLTSAQAPRAHLHSLDWAWHGRTLTLHHRAEKKDNVAVKTLSEHNTHTGFCSEGEQSHCLKKHEEVKD